MFTVAVPLEPPGIVPLLGPFWIENVWETLSLFWIRTVSVWLALTVGLSGEYLLPEIVTLSVVPPPPEGGDAAPAGVSAAAGDGERAADQRHSHEQRQAANHRPQLDVPS